MLLKDLLSRENNNLDIFRLIAASLVIISHAYVLVPENNGRHDFVANLLQFDDGGSLARAIS